MDIAETAGDSGDDARIHNARLMRQSRESEFAGIPIESEFIRSECLCKPIVGLAYSTRSTRFNGKHWRLAVSVSQPPRQMHLREILGRGRLLSTAPKRRTWVLSITEAERSGRKIRQMDL